MNYWVVAADGNKYGPADLATLNQWASENRLQPDSQLEVVETGMRVEARSVTGLVFPSTAPAPSAPYTPNPNVGSQAPIGSAGVGGPHQSPYPGRTSHIPVVDDGQKNITSAYLWGVFGFLFAPCCCFPILFYIPAFKNANAAEEKGHASGQTTKIVLYGMFAVSLLAIIFFIWQRAYTNFYAGFYDGLRYGAESR